MFLILLFLSFLLSLVLTGWLIKYLNQELLDIPNQRSSHSQPVLRGGGLAFIIAFALTGLIGIVTKNYHLGFDFHDYWRIWLVLTPLAIIGFIDDRRDISAKTRYLVQLLSASIGVFCFGTVPIPWLSGLGILGAIIAVIFSLIAITAFINFYNFMDGLDGFVASITAVQLAFIALYLEQPIFLLLVSALMGFLWWNWHPAKIFMGDVGSTVLGASVAIALLSGRQEFALAWSALSVTFPLIGDSIYTLIRRLINKENIFEPHRSHIYQRLQQSGLSHDRVAIIYVLVTLISAGIIYWFGAISIGINLLLVVSIITLAEVYLAGEKKTLPQPEREAIKR
ncbi:MAG: glycosyltransferase family 4 protein [Pleurocapsa sp.]